MTNEFAEVILGGCIAIPIAVAFFGLTTTQEIAASGAYDLGFQSMPIIFQRLPLGHLFGCLWFGLLFFAGITSSVAMGQPIMAFLQEEFGLSRRKAVAVLSVTVFLFIQPVILFRPFLGEMDFWSGTIGLALFALIETILFAWVFGMDRAWEEITRGADIRIPRAFYYIIRYVTPAYLLFIFGFWIVQDAWPTLLMRGVAEADRAAVLWARGMMLFFLVAGMALIGHVFNRHRRQGRGA